MLNLGIVIRPIPGGINLFCANPDLLHTMQEDSPLRFGFNCSDYRYVNYTGLPEFNLSTNILYFNNRDPKILNSNRLQLHKNNFAGIEEVIAVSQGTIEIPDFNEKKRYRITDEWGNNINYSNTNISSGKVSITAFYEGLIFVYEEKKLLARFYLNREPVWKKPLGILDIYPGQLYSQINESGPIEYIVNFNNRHTVWKYFFVNPSFQKYKNLTIINKAKDQVFKTPVKSKFQNLGEVLVFESNSAIPFEENSANSFQLVDGFESKLKSGKIIIKTLANASPDMIYTDNNRTTEKFYSYIFI